MPIMICCEACHGTGQIASAPLTSAFNCLDTREWRSTKQVHDALPLGRYIGQTAVSNRLAKLMALKLVTMEKRGREKFWLRVTRKAAAKRV
jgi:hypothetical protein